MTTDSTPAKVRFSAQLGLAPEREEQRGTILRTDAIKLVAEIERLRADAARAKGLIQRLATEARQSGDLVRDPEALALAAMYYGA